MAEKRSDDHYVELPDGIRRSEPAWVHAHVGRLLDSLRAEVQILGTNQ